MPDTQHATRLDPVGPRLSEFIARRRLRSIIRAAREEDMGRPPRDLTSELLIPARARARATFRAREAGRLAGAALLPAVVDAYDPQLTLTPHTIDGQALAPGAAVAEMTGRLRSILALERVALNFLMQLSGIATLTARFVEAIADTRARIMDTRKTHPGLRELEKYAVACGGGRSHRMGLHDAVLVKDNHIAHLSMADLPGALARMVRRAATLRPAPAFIEVEVDRLEQLDVVLSVRPDLVLLDNMPPPTLRQAVAVRDRLAPTVKLEASGGVSLRTVQAIADSGVDYISVGALTHSAPSLDLALDIDAS